MAADGRGREVLLKHTWSGYTRRDGKGGSRAKRKGHDSLPDHGCPGEDAVMGDSKYSNVRNLNPKGEPRKKKRSVQGARYRQT